MSPSLPEIETPAELTELLVSAPEWQTEIGSLERSVLQPDRQPFSFESAPAWAHFVEQVRNAYRAHDFVIVRRFPAAEDGSSLLMAALAADDTFRTYRSHQVVKRFDMSPWVKGLSHTTKEGDFHTDLNTEEAPPELTAIQCRIPDPGAPEYGQNRVARLSDLLRFFQQAETPEVAEWLTESPVTMANGRGQSWTGTIVENGTLRYHPVTLRDAEQTPEVEAVLPDLVRAVHEAALAVSQPFDLKPGDTLLVSNRRALHYRGECSVRFSRFPTDYEARSIFVLHMLGEPR